MPPWSYGGWTSTMSSWAEWKDYLSIVFASSEPSIQPVDYSPQAMTDTPACRYPLDGASSDVMTLADGRKLSYAQFGSSTGKPIIYCHGIPGSRLEAAQFDPTVRKLGGRLIAIDRPGHGLSTPQPNRRVLDYAEDVRQLTEHLRLEEYRVIGVSGGGPYALACAYALPADKLKAISVIVGLGPTDIGMKGADWVHWIAFPWGWLYAPAVGIRWFIHRQPIGRLHLPDEKRFEMWQKEIKELRPKTFTEKKNFEFLNDKDRIRVAVHSSREGFRQGFDGMLVDGKALSSDLGFRVENIRPDLRLNLFYGKYDTDVPPNIGVQIAARFRGEARLHIAEETHASVASHCQEQFFRELLED